MGAEKLPVNEYFDYPLQQVSTLECRTVAWEDMPASCKISLPIIAWGNYSKYETTKVYTDIYTTLWAANYQESRNQKGWAHAWVDIATAKWTPLYSIGDGKVYFAWEQAWYGNVVKIQYNYKWDTVYAIYGHMSVIDVKTWDTVRRWQLIGKVWNSWTTSWALWWYHVHFEITKDNYGRPMYSYNSCADVNKWHTTIIKQWLCRMELFANEYDPIVLIEDSKYLYTRNTHAVADSGAIVPDETVSWSTSSLTEEEQALVLSQVLKLTWSTVLFSSSSTSISLDVSGLNEMGKHFVSQYDILLQSDLPNKVIKVWSNWIIALMITKKTDWMPLDGLLSLPFDFVSSTTSVVLDTSSVKLISDGKIIVSVMGNKKWAWAVIVNLGWKKIAKINYLVE